MFFQIRKVQKLPLAVRKGANIGDEVNKLDFMGWFSIETKKNGLAWSPKTTFKL